MKIHKIAAIAAAMVVAGAASAGDNTSTAQKIQMLDTNGDGQVSASEYTAKKGKTQADFAKVDTNADGFVTAAEMDAHAAMARQNDGSMDKDMNMDRNMNMDSNMDMNRAQGTQDTTPTPTTATPPPVDDN